MSSRDANSKVPSRSDVNSKSPSSKAATCDSRLNRELKLAQLKIKKLELEVEAANRMAELKSNLAEQINHLEDEERSVKSNDTSRLPSPRPYEKVERTRAYVQSVSLPRHCSPDPITFREPAMHVVAQPTSIFETAQLLQACMSLPARQPVRFDGNPMNYLRFIRSFQTTVAKYTADPVCLLDHLISACEGDAADAIQRCIFLEPQEGYDEALRILERRFGQPHQIARQFIDELIDGPTIRSSDAKDLVKLADQMMLCSATLKGLNYHSDLNACRTLSAIVQRLPHHIQMKWSERASRILRSKREPTFDELSAFVSDQGDTALACLAYMTKHRPNDNNRSDVRRPPENRGPSVRPATVMTTLTGTKDNECPASPSKFCVCCRQTHYLDQCQLFEDMTVAARYSTLKRHNLCFLCLKPNHSMKTCRSRKDCGLNGCRGHHHPMLHQSGSPDDRSHSTNPVNVASINYVALSERMPVQRSSLAVLPVRLRGPLGEVTVNAFLDNGSDTTLIHRSLKSRLGLTGEPTSLIVDTMNGKGEITTTPVSLELISSDGTATIQVHRAWTVDALPNIKVASPPMDLQAWSHLDGVPLPPLQDSDVQMLIGTDVPKAHWVWDQRTGEPDNPYSVRGPLGWVILGPVGSRFPSAPKANVHCPKATEEIDATLERKLNVESAEVTCTKVIMPHGDKVTLHCMTAPMHLMDRHYEVELPWNPGVPCLPENHGGSNLVEAHSGKGTWPKRIVDGTTDEVDGKIRSRRKALAEKIHDRYAYRMPNYDYDRLVKFPRPRGQC